MNVPLNEGGSGDSAPAGSRHRLLWTLGVALLLVLAVVGLRYRARSIAQPPGGPPGGGRSGAPVTVGTARAGTADVPVSINALGTVTPLATVTVHPQVTGPLTKIAFTEGQVVHAGDLLAEIDARPFQAALDQSLGQLKRDQALLANARVDLERYKTLLAQQSVSEQTYATQVSTVAQDEATVALDQAAVESARLNLGYCRITSPVTGLVGLRQVDVGNLLQASASTIAVVTQMQPMSVLFTVPEDNVAQILRHLRSGEKLSVEVFDRSLSERIATGTLGNSDNQIDTTTGTLKLRALFDNARLELFPNQFVNARLILETLHDQVVVPAAALQNGSQGSYVYLVNADSTVSMRPVTVGPSLGERVTISRGVTADQTVVVDGADQLRDGARITLPQDSAPAAGTAGDGGRSSGQQRHRRDGAAGGGTAPP